VPFTNGFRTPEDLTDHFDRHAVALMIATEAEYLESADRFIGGPRDPQTTRECYRQNGDRLRYNEFTEEFAVMDANGYIETYYIPEPEEHEQPNNLEYFFKECQK
jgi:pyocin large subunit-like protein